MARKADAASEPKRRGRKAKDAPASQPVLTIDLSAEEATDTAATCCDGVNVIMYLPISVEEAEAGLEFSEMSAVQRILQDQPALSEPTPYTPDMQIGSFLDRSGSADKPPRACRVFHDEKSGRCVRDLLVDTVGDQFPDRTEVKCWWCSSRFETPPCGLPVARRAGLYHMYGLFCSYNCACAYLFTDYQHRDNLWTCYGLLNHLYRTVHGGQACKVLPAPPRQALVDFGGDLSIEQFRAANQTNDRTFNLRLPPMTMVIPQVEEQRVRAGEAIPVNRHKMTAGAESMRLQRSKPVVEHRHTLDSYMNIKTTAVK